MRSPLAWICVCRRCKAAAAEVKQGKATLLYLVQSKQVVLFLNQICEIKMAAKLLINCWKRALLKLHFERGCPVFLISTYCLIIVKSTLIS